MTIVLTTVYPDDPELVDAHLAFHLNAGVDVVLAARSGSDAETGEVLERYRKDGGLRMSETSSLAGLDVGGEHRAEWLIESAAHEFWWPRGESLEDVVSAIPARYTIVQALVRPFVLQSDDRKTFVERQTARRTISADQREGPERALRPMARTGLSAEGSRRDLVPLRAWYPIEVLRLPDRGGEPLADEAVERGLADGSLVVDTRLRDALASLREAKGRPSAASGGSPLGLRAPNVVDDAAYAVECAAVGEVDLATLDRHIRELEARIAFLEQKLWPRMLRTASRVVRRGHG